MKEPNSPFFLGINNMAVDPSNQKSWFKNAAVGKNKLGDMMKEMAKESGLNGKFCNHTARKTSLTNLLQAGLPPTMIKRISGHKNEQSIGHYATASNAQVKFMNDILLNPSENVPQLGQINPNVIGKEATPPPASISSVPKSDSEMKPTETGVNVPTEFTSELTRNQTDASGLLRNATLSNCTFHISYNIFGEKK